jgi:hypothetical protein
MSELLELVNSISTILWSIVGLFGSIILLWCVWQLVQIVGNIREYFNDFIGFRRGEIHKVAEIEKIEILKPPIRIKQSSFGYRLTHPQIWDMKAKE